jgi:hypothetical protein
MELGMEDRRAIVLRFFEQRDLRSVADALGSSEDAAQKRVMRALEKMHLIFKRRGVTLSAAALGTALAAEAVTAAPVGLAASAAGTALAGAAAESGISLLLIKAITMTNAKLAIAATIVAVAATTSVVLQHASQTDLRQQNYALRQQLDQLSSLAGENDRLSNLVAQAKTAQPLTKEPSSELLSLRGEVGVLRNRTNDLEKLLASVSRASQAPKPPPVVAPENQFPRASWKFAGYATPEAAWQSITWAMSRADITNILNSYVPEVRKAQKKEWKIDPRQFDPATQQYK